MSEFDHVPVMRQEIVDAMGPTPPGVVLDATLGAGGHSEAFLVTMSECSDWTATRTHSTSRPAGSRRTATGS